MRTLIAALFFCGSIIVCQGQWIPKNGPQWGTIEVPQTPDQPHQWIPAKHEPDIVVVNPGWIPQKGSDIVAVNPGWIPRKSSVTTAVNPEWIPRHESDIIVAPDVDDFEQPILAPEPARRSELPRAQSNPRGAAVAQAQPLTESIEQAAAKMSDAGSRKDYQTLVDAIYPGLVKLYGGRQKMIQIMRAGTRETEARGVKIVSQKIGTPRSPFFSHGRLFSIVPTVNTMAGPSVRITEKTFLLAISTDNGRSWTFVGGLSSELLSKALPELGPPSALHLPRIEEPTIEQTRYLLMDPPVWLPTSNQSAPFVGLPPSGQKPVPVAAMRLRLKSQRSRAPARTCSKTQRLTGPSIRYRLRFPPPGCPFQVWGLEKRAKRSVMSHFDSGLSRRA